MHWLVQPFELGPCLLVNLQQSVLKLVDMKSIALRDPIARSFAAIRPRPAKVDKLCALFTASST